MSFGGNSELARKIYDALSEHAYERAAGHADESVVVRNVAAGDTYSGRQGFIEYFRGWAAAFPDLVREDLNICGGDSGAVVEYRFEGTHTGPLLTPRDHIPATGMDVQVRFCDVLEIEHGRVVEVRSYFDSVSLLRQLGLAAGTVLHAPDRRAPLELYAQPVDSNAPQRNKAIVHRFIQEVFNRQNASAVVDSCLQEYRWHGGTLGESRGLQAYQGVLTSFFIALPDLELQVLDTIAEGDRVVIRFSMSGTHLGPFQGISPTQKRVVGGGTTTYRIADGRIAEEWWQGDLDLLLRRLDATPSSLRQGGPTG